MITAAVKASPAPTVSTMTGAAAGRVDTMPSATSTVFSASYDRTTKLVSGGIFVLMLLLALVIPGVFMGCLGALLLMGTYAWSPRSYTISERSILVRRLIGAVRIPLDEEA